MPSSNSNESFNISAGLRAHTTEKHNVIALQCGIHDKTVQRAMNGKLVSADTVMKIARGLGLELDDLVKQEYCGRVWIAARGGDFLKFVAMDFYDTLVEAILKITEEVRGSITELSNDAVAVEIKESANEISVSISSKLNSYAANWKLRPARLRESGVCYERFSNWDDLNWHDAKFDLMLNLSDDVTLNDLPYVSKILPVGWIVTFLNPDEVGLKQRVGVQHFATDADFCASINEFLSTGPVINVEFDERLLRIVIHLKLGRLERRKILIERAAFAPGGNPYKASFNRQLAEVMVREISTPNEPRLTCLMGDTTEVRPFGPCAKSMSTY
ncbi:hypothetical protein IDAT_03650 [Pseudidiomarina atlantica]|uniref:HTH cro/C1-type domain-containing protein n=1 Tax=Pseudidiomarina atlantica TaxID=1517416 RepID=A0A094IP46_9GAMM|nr:hypothetical protein [Pseudidiomarina atlantica]KFZ29455.1 hypothetical protein IDAT_03650 [Pseudidiomarina atlantica]